MNRISKKPVEHVTSKGQKESRREESHPKSHGFPPSTSVSSGSVVLCEGDSSSVKSELTDFKGFCVSMGFQGVWDFDKAHADLEALPDA